MTINDPYELSLGRLTLPPKETDLLDNGPVAPESGNWKSAIPQGTASVMRDRARRGFVYLTRRAPSGALAANCFADPTRIRIGGAR
jgi:hypothetical protein